MVDFVYQEELSQGPVTNKAPPSSSLVDESTGNTIRVMEKDRYYYWEVFYGMRLLA